jgi:hypothetical protein
MTISLDDMVFVVRNGFDPMAQRLGLRGPMVAIKNTYFCLAYFGEAIGIEVLVEFDYFFVLALPFRTFGRDVLPDGLTGPEGHVRKMYLQQAMDRLRISHDLEDKQLQRLGGDYRNCEAMTSITVALVERSWAGLQERAEELFPCGGEAGGNP